MDRGMWLPWRALPHGVDSYRLPPAPGPVFWLVVERADGGRPIRMHLLRERTYLWRFRALVTLGYLDLHWVGSWYGWISSPSTLRRWQQQGLGGVALTRLLQLAQVMGVARFGVRLPADPLLRDPLITVLSTMGFAVGVVDAWYDLARDPVDGVDSRLRL